MNKKLTPEEQQIKIEKEKLYYQSRKDKKKEYYEKNKELIALKRKEYKQRNKDLIKEKAKEYRDKNKDIIKEKRKNSTKKYILTPEQKENKKNYLREYKLRNKEAIKIKNAEYNFKHREKRRQYEIDNADKSKIWKRKYFIENKEHLTKKKREWYLANKERIDAHTKEYLKNKLLTDPLYKLKVYSRNMIRKALVRNGYSKTTRTHEILGCSYEEFKLYLESHFQSWMNWDNYGKFNGELNYGWDIDHRVPLITAKTLEDIIKLNHYTNLQPLCSHTNRNIKRGKLHF